MVLNTFKNEFHDLLLQAYRVDIALTKEKLRNERVLSYCMLCASAFALFGSAACTESWLSTQTFTLKDLMKCNDATAASYITTSAAEWGYYSDALPVFSAVNDFTQRVRDADYSGELIGIYRAGDFDGTCYDGFSAFYIDCIVDVFTQLKKENCFTAVPFEKDLLLGLQYPDPTREQQEQMIDVSKRVNSSEWHQKMLDTHQA